MNIPSPPILSELLRLLLTNIRTSALPYSLLAVILYALLYSAHDQFYLNVWLSMVLGMHAINYSYANWCINRNKHQSPKSTLTVLAILTFLQSVAWSSSVWFTINNPDQAENILVITIVAAFMSVVMISMAPIWPLATLFGATSIAVGVFKFGQTGGSYPIISLAGIPYLAALTFQSRNIYLTIKNAIELNFRNQSLVELLRIESNEATSAKKLAQDANQTKSLFLASASHDLRQPLHALSLLLESLIRTQPTARQNLLIEKSLSATNDMANMLHAILDISRIEAGTITPTKVAFPLQPLLHKLEASLGPAADAKSVTYRSRETNYTVRTDPVLLEQILRNVIANAIHYTQDGGILIGFRRRGDALQIEVWDTGIGIAEDQLEHIFQEFYQIANPERDRQKGFGLGLSIVKGLANTLGHPYSLHSILGKGTCFKILVPITTSVMQDAPRAAIVVQPEKMDMSILVIDDDAAVRESIEILLTSWGCRCHAADGAEAAVTLASRMRPDIIISDYRLRNHKTGIQAIQQVHEALGEAIPALIITGDTSPLRLHELMAAEIPVLHKPISAQQLYNMITLMHKATLPDTEKYPLY